VSPSEHRVPARRRSWTLALAALVALQVIFLLVYRKLEEGRTGRGLRVAMEPRSEPGRDLLVELPDGSRVTVTARSGRYQLIHFWATWCPPCIEEIPSLSRLARRDSSRLRVWAVSTDRRWGSIRDFFRGDVPGFVVRDPGDGHRAYSVTGLPDSYLVDPEGRIIARFVGAQDWGAKEMDEVLHQLVTTGRERSSSSAPPRPASEP
jgi:thiol-disulfide isomerase/thioredoxin